MIVLTCSSCGKKLSAKESLAGKKVKCPGCGQVVAVTAAVPAGGADGTSSPSSASSDDRTVSPGPDSVPRAGTTAGDTIGAGAVPPSTNLQDATIDTQKREPEHDPSLSDFLSPPQADDELGRLGKYRILKILGHGGMGVVYKAEDPLLKRAVALKAMLPTLAASASAGKRFIREAQSMAAVEHDHVVRVHEVAEERGVPFLAMEFLKGEPLDARLARERALPVMDVIRIGREIAEGLAAAHERGLIHRDIKPGNIWLEGSKGRVKILDFGLARSAEQESGLTQQGAIIGTPAYMAPEQASGSPVDVRCDLFSLGVLLYRISCGQAAFQGHNTVATLMAVATHVPPAPASINPDIPPELSNLIMQLLEKNPDRRPGSAAALAEVLHTLEKRLQRAREVPEATAPLTVGPGNRLFDFEDSDAPPRQADHSDTQPLLAKEVDAPAGKPAPRRGKLPLLIGSAVLLLGLAGVAMWAAGVFRVPDERGDLVLETDDPDFSFSVAKEGGVTLEDRKSKKSYKVKAVPSGKDDVELEVTDDASELSFKTKTFTVKRGGKVALKAWFERKQAVVVKRPAGVATPEQIEVGKWAVGKKAVVFIRKDGVEEQVKDHEGSARKAFPPAPFTIIGVEIRRIRGQLFCDPITDADTPRLAKLVDLERLGLAGQTVTAKGLELITACKNLKSLDFGASTIDASAALPIVAQFKELEEYNIQHGAADEYADMLAKLPGVKKVHFWGSDITVKGFARLAKAPKLEELRIENRASNQAEVKALADAKNLRRLTIEGGAEILADLQALQKELPKCTIQFNRQPLPKSPIPDSWYQEVAKLPGNKLEAVIAKLKERNPGWDGKELRYEIKDGNVVELRLQQVSDIAPVRALAGLRELSCVNGGLTDLSPLRGLPLTYLNCYHTPLSDLAPLQGMKLTTLEIQNTGVADLTPLSGMPLEVLVCTSTKVRDLKPLTGMKLTRLFMFDLAPTDISPLKDMPLKNLGFGQASKHLDLVRSIKTLETINNKPAAEFWKEVEAQHAAFEQWIKEVAKLPADKQVEAVVAKLKERNPGWDGRTDRNIEGGIVTELTLFGNKVSDITPVRALSGLRVFLGNDTTVADLTPLQDLPLTSLGFYHSRIKDLAPLKNMPLTKLFLDHPAVTDLSPLQGKKLTHLTVSFTAVNDLSALRGMPLTALNVNQTHVNDLSPLRGMPLTELHLAEATVSDLSPLKGMKLSRLCLYRARVTDLSPLKDMKLTWIQLDGSPVADLSPLKDMPLTEMYVDVKSEHVAVLRSIKTLEKINDKPAAEFWKEVEAKDKPLTPVPDSWIQEVAKLSADKQVEAVVAKLKERNPGWDGKFEGPPRIENGVVVEVVFPFQVKGVTDLSPLRGLAGLQRLGCQTELLKDLKPLEGLKLRFLNCSHSQVADFSPLKGMPLTELWFVNTKVSDLSPLKGAPLTFMIFAGAPVADLSPLKGMALTVLGVNGTKVTDLSPLKDMPLKSLDCDFKFERDAELIRSIKTLATINDKPAAEFLKEAEAAAKKSALPESWFQEVAKLPAEMQVETVAAKLKERNPMWGGKLEHMRIEDGVVTGASLSAAHLYDLSPLRAWPALKLLTCQGPNDRNTPSLSDLSPLAGLKLELLGVPFTRVSDLKPLKGMKLTYLNCGGTLITDLKPLAGMPLDQLNCWGAPVKDYSPLSGMPLNHVLGDFEPRRDAEILRSIKTLEKINNKPVAEFWKEFEAKSKKP